MYMMLRIGLSTRMNSYFWLRIRTFRTPKYEFLLLENTFVLTGINLYLPTFKAFLKFVLFKYKFKPSDTNLYLPGI